MPEGERYRRKMSFSIICNRFLTRVQFEVQVLILSSFREVDSGASELRDPEHQGGEGSADIRSILEPKQSELVVPETLLP